MGSDAERHEGRGLSVPSLRPLEPELLERRARELASAPEDRDLERTLDRLVSFRLVGRSCALDARVVERAVTRLSRPVAVPLHDGGERLVAFVEERPVPVVDLVAFAGGRARAAEALEGQPALLVTTGGGPVVVAVDGPLELLEDHIAFAAEGGDAGAIRAAGRLSGGILALDPTWLQDWAEKAARP
jgi:hypothetical protein